MVKVMTRSEKYDYVKKDFLKFYIQKGYVVAVEEVNNKLEEEMYKLEEEMYKEAMKALMYVPLVGCKPVKEEVSYGD